MVELVQLPPRQVIDDVPVGGELLTIRHTKAAQLTEIATLLIESGIWPALRRGFAWLQTDEALQTRIALGLEEDPAAASEATEDGDGAPDKAVAPARRPRTLAQEIFASWPLLVSLLEEIALPLIRRNLLEIIAIALDTKPNRKRMAAAAVADPEEYREYGNLRVSANFRRWVREEIDTDEALQVLTLTKATLDWGQLGEQIGRLWTTPTPTSRSLPPSNGATVTLRPAEALGEACSPRA